MPLRIKNGEYRSKRHPYIYSGLNGRSRNKSDICGHVKRFCPHSIHIIDISTSKIHGVIRLISQTVRSQPHQKCNVFFGFNAPRQRIRVFYPFQIRCLKRFPMGNLTIVIINGISTVWEHCPIPPLPFIIWIGQDIFQFT